SARLNPHIDFTASAFTVNQVLADWAAPEVGGRRVPRLAGLSSFGAGGSNAHMVVEEYEAPAAVAPRHEAVAIVLSARSERQLRQKAADLLAFADAQAPDLEAMAYTLQVGREAMGERLGLVVRDLPELAEKLRGFIEGAAGAEGLHRGQVQRHRDALA